MKNKIKNKINDLINNNVFEISKENFFKDINIKEVKKKNIDLNKKYGKLGIKFHYSKVIIEDTLNKPKTIIENKPTIKKEKELKEKVITDDINKPLNELDNEEEFFDIQSDLKEPNIYNMNQNDFFNKNEQKSEVKETISNVEPEPEVEVEVEETISKVEPEAKVEVEETIKDVHIDKKDLDINQEIFKEEDKLKEQFIKKQSKSIFDNKIYSVIIGIGIGIILGFSIIIIKNLL